jgi:exodeoxyribonuclease-3
LNVANEEIDIHNPKGNKKNSGFTDEERNSFKQLLKDCDLIDSFRHVNEDTVKYSFWTYLHSARSKNKGWRIDYFLVPKKIINLVKDSDILTDVMGSDHAPVMLKLVI